MIGIPWLSQNRRKSQVKVGSGINTNSQSLSAAVPIDCSSSSITLVTNKIMMWNVNIIELLDAFQRMNLSHLVISTQMIRTFSKAREKKHGS